ncbi:RagB/SusD family nutrient uptake outer membrane protein [Pedobacter gandavensis]|uniref:RagB/SusD family nutrient uptake outer membrane protein n=1 Tax=Pedobacter gandavensis TaxID=2679963 RepID=UPI00247A5D7E|nr:RagB/SusD family nutrient uptake outer membrane protein [Pedobacter gandavensis]WGQ09721.1 RagB/SusD family nutrient uptake outer membrane protein [Pedobacter gandavensis]
MNNLFSKWCILLYLPILVFNSCKKDFLDAKPNTAIIQPITLDDFQGLLESSLIGLSPSLPTMSADEYNFISYASYQGAGTATERNAYIWAKDLFEGEIAGGDWSKPYETIFCSNNILAGLDKMKGTEKNTTRLNFIYGWALFNRAYAFYELVRTFSPAYDQNTANTDLGVPLKLNPSIEELQQRSTVQQTYDQILEDLKKSLPLFDSDVPQANRYHPSKTAVHALLSRIYLSMRKYDLAELHADATLQLYNKLINYNTVSKTNIQPFNRTNDELILRKSAVLTYTSTLVAINTQITINPDFLLLYELGDLRDEVYFKESPVGIFSMKRMYNGTTALQPFTGLATDEVYLIKAECAARRSDISTALSYLNNLLINRYETNKFTAVTASSPTEALNKILLERKKELIWRNLRWDDLKRLNKEGANIQLNRELNGSSYTLPPNDSRYVFPIPDNEVLLSGIKQNQR